MNQYIETVSMGSKITDSFVHRTTVRDVKGKDIDRVRVFAQLSC